MLDRQTVSHYLPWDIQGLPHQRVLALCGRAIRIDEGTGDPTCPVCRERLRAWVDDELRPIVRVGESR